MTTSLRACILSFAIIFTLAVLAGCGGNASPSPTASTPTPPSTPTSPTTPTTPTTPTPPTPTSSGATTQFLVTLSGSDSKTHGTLSVDTAGDVHVNLTGAVPGTYNLTFTSFNSDGWSTPPMNIASVVADASGNASGTFHFPQSGTWVGDFGISNSSNSYYDKFTSGSAAAYQAILVQANSANAGRGSQLNAGKVPQDPLASGSVKVTNGALQLTLTGAVPNVTYYLSVCGQQCEGNTPFTTDASGNGSLSFTFLNLPPGDIFDITRLVNNTAHAVSGFDSGFKVP